MAVSLSQISLPVFRQMLEALSAVLDKAAAHCTARKIDPAVLLQDRLYPDMFPLTRQVETACSFAVRSGARLAGIDIPTIEAGNASFDDLKDRIARSLAFLGGLDTKAIDAAAGREITFPMGQRTATMTGTHYLMRFALPHFFFHCTAAYAILRHDGVEVGKGDYMGKFEG